MTFIEQYVSFAMQTRYQDIPPEVVKIAKMSLIDTIGIILYASQSPYAKNIAAVTACRSGVPEATWIGYQQKLSMRDAALVNGMLAHLDDYDEVSIPGHTAAVAVPAILALAETYQISGVELLRAYCLGIELDFKIAKAACDAMSKYGWHTTSVIGILGVSAMAAIVLQLDYDQFCNALGIAASRAGGIVENFGTLTKPYHIGMAASCGIESAMLAKAGLTASWSAFEGKRGYFQAFTGQEINTPEWVCAGRWEIQEHGMLFKKYPSCLGSHSSVNTLTRMKKEYQFSLDDVVHITAGVGPYSYSCLKYQMPQNTLEAKFSMDFPLAEVLIHGVLKGSDYRDENVCDSAVREVMKKISLISEPSFQHKFVHENSPCVLEVILKDGRILRESGEIYYFTPKCWDNLLSEDELFSKFADCAQEKLTKGQALNVCRQLMNLEHMSDIREIMKLF